MLPPVPPAARSHPRSAAVTLPYLPVFLPCPTGHKTWRRRRFPGNLRHETEGNRGINGCVFAKPGCRDRKMRGSGAVTWPDSGVSYDPVGVVTEIRHRRMVFPAGFSTRTGRVILLNVFRFTVYGKAVVNPSKFSLVCIHTTFNRSQSSSIFILIPA